MKFMYLATKRFSFEAAHHLKTGKCAAVHGHSYKAEVTVSAGVLDDGKSFDFDEIGSVRALLDHKDLNALLGEDQPTAENVARFIYRAVLERINSTGFGDDVVIEKVVVIETPDNEVELISVSSKNF